VADVSKYNQGNIGTGDGNITQSQFDEYKKTVVTIDGKELTNSYTYAKYDFSGSSIPDVYGGFNVRTLIWLLYSLTSWAVRFWILIMLP
jgi:hypothetical protein